MCFFSSNNAEKSYFGEHEIKENEDKGTTNETASNLSKEVATKKDNIQRLDVISNETVNFPVC